ncbi:primosomal protein N' [Candidatus Erwinia haradaeae]|uniref:Replication restart protein PriA n=1 Tax=Candidatus Erwinia haradaeae TaxID=1922217 RepID=A0A803FUM2_9GAMM|nr:primosomal protein N' [Candidatus Erwinia haradaeae]VFP88870.1 Primosomal protein N' [Candidatus Erwinia haradaeae]
MSVIQVALPIPYSSNFDYLLPIHIKYVVVGGRVRVPFGNRKEIGIVVSIKNSSIYPYHKLKKIDQVLDIKSLYHPNLWLLLNWISNYYHLSLGQILFYSLPILLRKGELLESHPLYHWVITSKGRKQFFDDINHNTKTYEILTKLYYKPLYNDDTNNNKITNDILQSLASKDLCKLEKIIHVKQDWHKNYSINNVYLHMNIEQRIAISTICKSHNNFIVWLFMWTINYDKTAIYLCMIENIMSKGKQILILVPQINLILKMIRLCQARFKVPIDIFHSKLNNKKRLNAWKRSRSGETAIIIGTNSVIFTPLHQLGLIILDDEHHVAYQNKKGGRYNIRDIAILRAKQENIPIIMGSTTPSLKTLHNVDLGKYHEINLRQSQYDTNSVIRTLVNIKNLYLKNGLSPLLIERMRLHLNKNNQILLFLNRRGFSPILLCHECNLIIQCEICHQSYTLHKNIDQLQCHSCQRSIPIPYKCFNCGSKALISIGIGTEQLELNLKVLFPNISITRIDTDTIPLTGKLEEKLKNTDSSKAHILVGTQMIIQECFFSNVTLVILLEVDNILFSTDFRSVEYFAQLYHQIVRMLKNNSKKGEIIFQTCYPEHPTFQTLLNKDYIFFAKTTLAERKNLLLPPYIHQVILNVEDKDNKSAYYYLVKIYKLLKLHPIYNSSLQIIGPTPLLSVHRSNQYKWQLALYHPSLSTLHQITKLSLISIKNLLMLKKIKLTLEIN